jgi:hypothetical protein
MADMQEVLTAVRAVAPAAFSIITDDGGIIIQGATEVDWVAEGSTRVGFTAPTDDAAKVAALNVVLFGTPTPDRAALRLAAYQAAYTADEFQEAVIEHLLENRPERLQAIQAARLAIKQEYP